MRTAGVLARVVACVGSLLLAAACADGRGAHEGDETLDSQLATCLEDAGHGEATMNVDMRRQLDSDFNEAFEECAQSLGIDVPSPGEVTRQIDAVVVGIFECMTAAGWDIPEPSPSEYGTLVLDGIERKIPEDQLAAFEADYQTCVEDAESDPSHNHEDHPHDHGDHEH